MKNNKRMRQSNENSKESGSSKKVAFESDGIKNLDIMGEKFKFGYTKEAAKYQTKFGGCITILVTGLSLGALVFIAIQYFDTSSPVVTTSRELSNSAQSFNVYGKDLLSGISISSGNVFEPLKMNHFMTIKGQIVKKSFDPQTNSTKIDLSKSFNYIPCPQITEDQSLVNLVKRIIHDSDPRISLCPLFKEVGNDATLSFDPGNLSSSYLAVKIYPCSLPDPNECYPIQKIFGAELTSYETSNLITPSNYHDPVTFRFVSFGRVLDLTRTKSYRFLLQQKKILDERQFLQKPEIKAEYAVFSPLATDSWARDMTQIYCNTTMIDAGKCEEYMEFVYEMDSEVFLTTRRYKKIPALLGEFGGILKLLTTMFVILSFYYIKAIKSFLFDKVFGIKKSKARKIMKKEGLPLVVSINQRDQPEQIEIAQNIRAQPSNDEAANSNQKIQPRKKINSELIRSLEEAINQKTDIIELVKKMNLVDVLKEVSLQKHHQILLPLALLKSEQSADQRRWPSASEEDLQAGEGKERLSQDFSKKQYQNKYDAEDQSPERNQTHKRLFKNKKSYDALKNAKPKNSLERMFNEEMLIYLSSVYEHE